MMSMPVLLLHGEEILGVMAAAVLGLLLFPAILIWLWCRPPRNPLVPTIIYVVIALATFVAVLVDDDIYALMLATIVYFPWSAILFFVSPFLNIDLGSIAFLVAGAINAALIYGVGKLAKKN